MKIFKKLGIKYVLIEEDGEAPRVIDVEECQKQLQAIRNQKARLREKEDIVEAEIAEALLVIQNTSPN